MYESSCESGLHFSYLLFCASVFGVDAKMEEEILQQTQYGRVVRKRVGKETRVVKWTNVQLWQQAIKEYKTAANPFREAAILRLIHQQPNVPGIVRFHKEHLQVQADEQWHAIVIEDLPGGDLLSLLQRSKSQCLSEDTVRLYGFQIATSIAFLHGMSIAHLDIKPENIVLDKTSKLHLVDFGLSEYIEENCRKKKMMRERRGTIGYIAPEVYVPNAVYDPFVADCWSFGCLLHVMLLGFHPYSSPPPLVLPTDKKAIIDPFAAAVHGGKTAKYLADFAASKHVRLSDKCIDLLSTIFVLAANRPTIKQILAHSFWASG